MDDHVDQVEGVLAADAEARRRATRDRRPPSGRLRRTVALTGAMTLTTQDSPALSAAAGHAARRARSPRARGRQVVQLLVGLAVDHGLFILLGWGDLLLFIAILIVIVMLHELGHFATAKWAGMKVTEYFVGFGPAAVVGPQGRDRVRRQGHPRRRLRPHHRASRPWRRCPRRTSARAYRQQPFGQRIIVASAGSVMHLLIAFVLAMILVFSFGQPTNNYTVAVARAVARHARPRPRWPASRPGTPSSPSTARRSPTRTP